MTMYRSTKGASKARRDQINAEIRNLQELLPFADTDKAKLSYLHIMSLACMYARKMLFFSQGAPHHNSMEPDPVSFQELSELICEFSGFFMLITGDGKLIYLSDNVVDYLGLGMVDLAAQTDSVYDIIDPSDHFIMRSNLTTIVNLNTDLYRLYRCRFNISKYIRRQGFGDKIMLVRARCLTPLSSGTHWTSNPVWLCFCTPLKLHPPTVPRSPLSICPPELSVHQACFHSQHHRDMSIWDVHDSVSVYLGYKVDFLRSRSWYSLLHPRDLTCASDCHQNLLSDGGLKNREIVVQLEAANHAWVWLYMVFQLNQGEHPIFCTNFVISETEAFSLRQQLCWEEKNQYAGLKLQSFQTPSSPPQVFTPGSSGLSTQSFDFDMSINRVSSSDETTKPVQNGPPSSLPSVEDGNFFQRYRDEHRRLFYGPSESSSSASMSEPESDILTENISNRLAGPPGTKHNSCVKHLTPLTTQLPQHMEECLYSTPSAHSYSSSSYTFNEKPLQSSADSSHATLVPQNPYMTASHSIRNFSKAIASDCSSWLDAVSNGTETPKCDTADLPEIMGPMYVDVPGNMCNLPSDSVLTPESSIELPFPIFFSVEKELDQEQKEISHLAKYISSLADGFYCNNPLAKNSQLLLSPSASSAPSLSLITPTSLGEGDNYPWSVVDKAYDPEDVSLFEENLLLETLIEDLSSSHVPHSLCSSTSFLPLSSQSQNIPLTPGDVCPPYHSMGENHLSSVQLAQSNYMAVDGSMIAFRTGYANVMEQAEDKIAVPLCDSTSNLTASLQQNSAFAYPAPILGLSQAQFLIEECAATDVMFEADVSISPSWGNTLSCINSQSTPNTRSFHQGESLPEAMV